MIDKRYDKKRNSTYIVCSAISCISILAAIITTASSSLLFQKANVLLNRDPASSTIPMAYSQTNQSNTNHPAMNQFKAIQQLGEYKIVDVANVPHLQDKDGFFVFPASCPTACSAAWIKILPPPVTEPRAPIATSGENTYVVWWTNKTGNWEVMFRASLPFLMTLC